MSSNNNDMPGMPGPEPSPGSPPRETIVGVENLQSNILDSGVDSPLWEVLG